MFLKFEILWCNVSMICKSSKYYYVCMVSVDHENLQKGKYKRHWCGISVIASTKLKAKYIIFLERKYREFSVFSVLPFVVACNLVYSKFWLYIIKDNYLNFNYCDNCEVIICNVEGLTMVTMMQHDAHIVDKGAELGFYLYGNN